MSTSQNAEGTPARPTVPAGVWEMRQVRDQLASRGRVFSDGEWKEFVERLAQQAPAR